MFSFQAVIHWNEMGVLGVGAVNSEKGEGCKERNMGVVCNEGWAMEDKVDIFMIEPGSFNKG